MREGFGFLRLARLQYSREAGVRGIQAECVHPEARLDVINMRLKNLKYSDAMPETGQRWTLTGLELDARNLIVGKNASGKSRTLSVIHVLSRQLTGLLPLAFSANYDMTFVDDSDVITSYELRFTNGSVDFERLTVGNFVKLDRGTGGVGKIWANEVQGGMDISFQVPLNQL